MLYACSSSFLYSIVEFVVGNYQLQFYLNILFCRKKKKFLYFLIKFFEIKIN